MSEEQRAKSQEQRGWRALNGRVRQVFADAPCSGKEAVRRRRLDAPYPSQGVPPSACSPLFALCSLLFALSSPLFAQRQYGFDNRKASGQPYLTPDESLKRMKVAPGYEVKLFAAEPDVVNPIAFTIDERGRVWVVECFEYPNRTPKGKMPRDRIKILEDTDGDGKCDKSTIWAEGKDFPVRFDLASGIEVGHGGVFLGAPPYLFFLQDTNNDGKCDKYEILLKGFGSQDTHETLNTFQWGPDGRLYGLHGIFTESAVTPATPAEPGADAPGSPVRMNAAVWRYDVRTKTFEVFAEGTSNPWGMDFDANGNCFVCCCVIPHLFHIVPGGIYIRQAGASKNPYAYGYLKEISDHTHHKESGWAHAGLLIMDGKHVPEEYRGSVLMGSIHGCSIKRDVLRRNGSTFIASHAEDFLVSGDKNFRPINIRWGPNGDIYVIDWHDQNPCHQAPADAWDYERGRIYRIQRVGAKSSVTGDVAKEPNDKLIDLLFNENYWKARTAMRLLHERRMGRDGAAALLSVPGPFANRGPEVPVQLLWTLHGSGLHDELVTYRGLIASLAIGDPPLANPWVRTWGVRLLAESGPLPSVFIQRLIELAKSDTSPAVRAQLTSAAKQLAAKHDTLPLLHNLMLHKEDANDPVIPLMLWLAYEPKVAKEPKRVMEWLWVNAAGNPLVTNEIVPRVMRRIVATGDADSLRACMEFLLEVTDREVRRRALQGLAEALKGRQTPPPTGWRQTYPALLREEDAEIQRLARRLAVHFLDAQTIALLPAVTQDTRRPKDDRLEAIHLLALAHPPEGLPALLDVLTKEKDESLRQAAAGALGRYDSKDVPALMLSRWKDYPVSVRIECVNILKSRKEWAGQLLTAVGNGRVPRTDLTDNTILAIRSFRDAKLNEQIEKVWGRFRDTPAELNKLIAKMRNFVQEAPGDGDNGRKVFEKNCMQCHRFDGKGHDVGPNLDGAERSLEYLLTNVLDPNRVVGQPYYTRVVLLKSGRLITGLLSAEDGQSISLKRENDVVEVIPRKDIEEMKTEEKSLMPEGLANNMTPEEFRDLVIYLQARR